MAKKWIQGAIKRKGRFKGKNKQDLQATKARLHRKAQKGKLTSAERSLMSAATLGIRFKSGEFRKKRIPRPK